MRIFGDVRSGNCLKVKYTADWLGLEYEWLPIDIMQGESRTPDFLARNPYGQVPVVEFNDARCLAQSNAIIRYLARDTALLPKDPFVQAKVDELLFWEQYSHEPYVAVCRFQVVYEGRALDARDAWRVTRAEQALDQLDGLLAGNEWLVGNALTVADIALLAYTRLAPEGGFDLSARSHTEAWIRRCEAALGLS